MSPRLVGVALLLTAAFGAGCNLSTDCAAVPSTLAGQWVYDGDQTAPPATLSGTLTLATGGCPGLQGSLDLTQDEQGMMTSFHGVVSGQMASGTMVEFTASNGMAVRTHLGNVANDSIKGTWVEQSGNTITGGSFVAARGGTP